MSALHRVDWGAAMDVLFHAAPRPLLAACRWYVARSTWLPAGPMAFAVLVLNSPRALARQAIACDPAHDWAVTTARAVLGTMQDLPARDFPTGGLVYVDPQLPPWPEFGPLPLLGAATAHALATVGRLAVYVDDLQPGIDGRYHVGAVTLPDGAQADAAIIEITTGQNRVWSWACETWRHEISHLFDPGLTAGRTDQRTSEEREAYADTLMDRLARLSPNAPLHAVQPIARQTYREIRRAFIHGRPAPTQSAMPGRPPGAGLPAPGLPSLLVWATLPVSA